MNNEVQQGRMVKRLVGAVFLVLLLTGFIALVVNLMLFRFGPWADVWFIETWTGLLPVGTLIAFVAYGRWLTTTRRNRD